MSALEATTDAALADERAEHRGTVGRLSADVRALQDAAAALEAEAVAAEERERLEAERVAALPGTVRFFRDASASFDVYTKAPDDEVKGWMRSHYDRMRVYSPYFDSRLAWFDRGMVYQDSYAIYVNAAGPSNLPWVLTDSTGGALYIPYGPKPYTQFAGDITNPAFRKDWIARTRLKLAKGYKGLFVDDVNFYRKVARADGTVPTGTPCWAGTLTDAVWRAHMLLFMYEIRQAFPDTEITHNVVWSVNPETAAVAEVAYGAADLVEVEHGVNDSGIKGGTGQWSLRTLLDWVDRRHAQGVGVIWDSDAKTDSEREYGLACYFLTSDGNDLLGSRQGGTPGDWWAGYDTQLGKPLDSRRHLGDGLLHRAFEGGSVYVLEPGGVSKMLPDGRVLGSAQGAVVLDVLEQAA